MKKKFWLFFLIPPAIALMIWVGGELVMHLWNWLAPAIFGWKEITFWQAFGLLALCRILFGGWGGHGKNGHGHDRGWQKGERWNCKTPEEREKIRQEMRARWCGQATPTSEPTQPAS